MQSLPYLLAMIANTPSPASTDMMRIMTVFML